jgi:hypothetical protein
VLLYAVRGRLTIGAESNAAGAPTLFCKVRCRCSSQCSHLRQNAHSRFVRLHVGADRYLIPCFIERADREPQRPTRGLTDKGISAHEISPGSSVQTYGSVETRSQESTKWRCAPWF